MPFERRLTRACAPHCGQVLRFYSFFATRVAGSLIALDIARQLEWTSTRILLLCMAAGVAYDNWRTLGRMRQSAKAATDGEPPGSPTKSWPL